MAIPVGKSDRGMFGVTNIRIVGNNSKTIQADFVESEESGDFWNIVYTAKLKPNDAFLSCVNTWTVANLVQYTGIFKHEGKAYTEFWTLHPYVPPELFPCEEPKVFEHSPRTDFSIILPKYEEFGFG